MTLPRNLPDYVNDHLKAHPKLVRPRLVCADGTTLSVQASSAHYCSPREDDAERYTSVEVWCIYGPSKRRVHPRSFGNSDSSQPYGWVPVELVNRFIHRHGGRVPAK